MITWEQLLSFDTVQGHTALKSKQPWQMLCRTERLWRDSTADDESVLYLIMADVLPTIRLGGISAVIFADDSIAELPEGVVNALILPHDSADAFMAELSRSYAQERAFGQEIEKLLGMVRDEADLEALTEELSDWLDRPVAVVDSAYRFVTKARGDEIDTFVPQFDRDPEGVTDERLKMLVNSGLMEKYRQARESHYFTVDDFTIYSIPLYLKGTNIGILGIPGKRGSGTDKLPPEYENELEKLAAPFELAFAFRRSGLHKRRQNLAFMFSYILEQEPEDISHVSERLKLFGYTLLPNMYLACVKSRSEEKFEGQVVADALRNIFSNSFYLFYGDELLFLISRPMGKTLTETELSIWDYQLGAMGLQAGISRAFTSFKDIRRVRHKEAALAQRVGMADGKKNLYLFEECAIPALLTDYADRDMLESYCYSPLMHLIAYDREKGAELTTTLREYLKNTKAPKEVCDRLYIHKNTLYKRLGKIEEIMGCELGDPEVIMQIQITFHILKLLDEN